MLYELRIYEATPGKMPALVNRFVNTTLKMFKKHGIRPVVFLEPVVGTSNQLTYLVEWESLAEREQRWNAFQSDPEWIAARAASEEAGPIVDRFTNTIFREAPAIMAVLRSE
jgi:hypothetical protein